MKTLLAPLAAGLSAVTSAVALAGPAQPFINSQPSLVVNELMSPSGVFPTRVGGGASGDTLGFVYDLAAPYAPMGTYSASGQSISIAQKTALFSILGTTYGGNGFSTFSLPNLQGRATIGNGGGSGLTLGSAVGASSVTLSAAEVPAAGQFSAAQAFNTVQPSLPLTPLIDVSGALPGSGSSAFVGQIDWFAGNFVPGGWAAANGQLLSIAQNPVLFSIIGTTYGGDGVNNFALPNLAGRIAIGADAGNPLGATKGSDTYTVTRSQLPGPGQTPLDNDQPSLAVNYLIATAGTFPTFAGDPFNPNTPALGEIVAYAGGFAPPGWALADGQLLSIAQNQALFAVIGDTYGGNGISTFALPDLDGRTIVGAGGGFSVGETFGVDSLDLTAGNIPATVPEPSVWTMTLIGFAAMGFALSRRRSGALRLGPEARAG